MVNGPTALEPQQIVSKALAKIGDIATLPEVTLRIVEVVEDPRSSARDLHAIIKNDPALSTKILKVVNSAFYGLPGQIANVDRAVVLLGLRAVKNIALAASVSRVFKGLRPVPGFNPKELWHHSLAVGVGSRLICRIRNKAKAEEAFLAGLIHDLGIIVALQAFSDRFAEVVAKVKQGSDWREAEIEVLGVDHQMLGMGLAVKWKFPMTLRTAMGYHHNPDRVSQENRWIATIVHIADLLAAQENMALAGATIAEDARPFDPQLLASVGMDETDLETIRDELPEAVLEAEAQVGS